jgi:tricorn protease
VEVEVGDYLLAVNGVSLDPSRDPWAAFQGLVGKTVTLTIGDQANIDDTREVAVEPLVDERSLRFRAWIEEKRAYVEESTNGRVGYIYVPDTGGHGQNELMRQFWSQRHKEALIIDERWNSGGNIPNRLVELLNRPVSNYWAHRYGEDEVWPPDAHHGPKCMLINGLAGSGGDHFPHLFRERGLGKLIGTRTTGGLVSVRRRFTLIDGSRVIAPAKGFYEEDGTWAIEGHGVDPDIMVIDDPALMVGGRDPQLEAAIDHIIAEIRRNPQRPPTRPQYPDRSGFGLDPEDV